MHSYVEANFVDGEKKIIEDLNKKNNLYFVTARGNELQDVTTKWLEKMNYLA